MGKVYGYARVSSRDQNEERQMIALEKFPVPPKRIFLDKQSGKDFNRPNYRRVLRRLKKDDVLVIKSIDRLGRNYDEILIEWRKITKEIGAAIVVLDMPLLDTRQVRGDLMGTFIADLVLQVLSYVAQTERDNIRQRQAEGIAAAKARGVRFGRQEKPLPENYFEVSKLWKKGDLSARKAAQQLGVSHPTFLNWIKKERGKNQTHNNLV